ncbi:MAG: hypothetical protein OD814_001731 [Candidatus Alkanophagales archaeon MCA70_species_1]|nr:hypothetical protein [Candidatus Alkanophaga volatiphilum]
MIKGDLGAAELAEAGGSGARGQGFAPHVRAYGGVTDAARLEGRAPPDAECGCGRKSKSTLLRQNLDITVFAAAKNGTAFRNPPSWVLLERKGV